jgi:hypothetical protein
MPSMPAIPAMLAMPAMPSMLKGNHVIENIILKI